MDQSTPRYPIGIQDFEKIRTEDYFYVDKTKFIYNLSHDGKYFCLSRPRRFGKSLLLSTLKAYFEGKKDLFEGLAIENMEKEWKRYPVLLLELSRTIATDAESLKEIINQQFCQWEELYGVKEKKNNLAARFADIIIKAHEKTAERVVILVDEYDNPLINALHNPEVHETNKELLISIYSNIKALDSHIRFAMLTDVSRFSHMSIFSGLNNLNDITLVNQYAEICGITSDELHFYFKESVERLAESLEKTEEETYAVLKYLYDGYHFSSRCPDIYNPFSLLCAFSNQQLGSYWMHTGTPTFLVKRMIDENLNLNEVLNSHATDKSLFDSDLSYSSIVALLFQTGYLTIKGYEQNRQRYKLGIPNKEVEDGLFEDLMKMSQYKDPNRGRDIIYRISDALHDGNPQEALEEMKAYLGGIGYPQANADKEFAFQNNLLIPLKLLGMDAQNEVHTSRGRIDMVVKTPGYLYLFEFKLNSSAEEALRQIEEKEYANSFQTRQGKLFKIGVNFSSEKRNIDSWLIEESF